jgi:hypothetical protein
MKLERQEAKLALDIKKAGEFRGCGCGLLPCWHLRAVCGSCGRAPCSCAQAVFLGSFSSLPDPRAACHLTWCVSCRRGCCGCAFCSQGEPAGEPHWALVGRAASEFVLFKNTFDCLRALEALLWPAAAASR